MGLTRLKFGKQQNCDSIRSMTISGVTVTGVDCTQYSKLYFCFLCNFNVLL